MRSTNPRIAAVRTTPIAFRDPPLLNVAGVHEAYALRSIIEVETEDGRIGLGESYGDLETLANLAKIGPLLVGLDPGLDRCESRPGCVELGLDVDVVLGARAGSPVHLGVLGVIGRSDLGVLVAT